MFKGLSGCMRSIFSSKDSGISEASSTVGHKNASSANVSGRSVKGGRAGSDTQSKSGSITAPTAPGSIPAAPIPHAPTGFSPDRASPTKVAPARPGAQARTPAPSGPHPMQVDEAAAPAQAAARTPPAGNPEDEGESGNAALLAVSPACPPAMKRDAWSILDFDLVSKIYSGKASRVYKAKDKRSGIEVALKLYKRSVIKDMQKIQAMREIQNHIALDNPHILAMYAAWVDTNYIYMVLELAPLGDLYRILRFRGSLPEKMIVSEVLLPLLGALECLHSQGLIHRDLKPENVVVTKQGIKLADLGLVINDAEEKPNTRLGTLDYMAPEIYAARHKAHPLEGKYDATAGYSHKVDVWAVGIIAYELLTGKPPFESEHVGDTIARICSLAYTFPDNMPPLAKDFIAATLRANPDERPDVSQLRTHPWITATGGHAATPIGGSPGAGSPPSRSTGGGGRTGGTINTRTGSSFSWAGMYSIMEPNNRITQQLQRATDVVGAPIREETASEMAHEATRF